jgi:hypothetical protein
VNTERAVTWLLVSAVCLTWVFTLGTNHEGEALRRDWQAMRSNRNGTERESAASQCPVTIGRRGSLSSAELGSEDAHRKGKLYVSGLWPNGTIVFRPGGAGIVYPDGSLGMKIGWYRASGLYGTLKINGKRLDASAPSLRAEIPKTYSDTGFQASRLIFPTEGCWQVTGTVADASVAFVTRVVKVAGLR